MTSMSVLLNAVRYGAPLQSLIANQDINLDDLEIAERAGHLQVVHRNGGTVSVYWALNRAGGQRHELTVELTPAGANHLGGA